ncbi:MAG: hypothetical protein QXP27_02865 [Candidatus Methanomethyliaceae archaeon]
MSLMPCSLLNRGWSGQDFRVVLTAPEEYAKRTRGALHGTWGSREAIPAHLEEERAAWEKP